MNTEIRTAPVAPPYADLLVVLAGNEVSHTDDPKLLPVVSRTRLHLCCDYIITLLAHLLVLSFMTYQIALACYNCGLQNSNLGWIRASFFMNIPFVLGTLIGYSKVLLEKRVPALDFVWGLVTIYVPFYFMYELGIGIYFDSSELKQIRAELNNVTTVNLLDCPVTHYQQVFGAKIAQLCVAGSPLLCCSPVVCLGCIRCLCQGKPLHITQIYDQFLFRIADLWKSFFNVIFQRHQEEIVITQ